MSDFQELASILVRERERLWQDNPRLRLQELWRRAAGDDVADETEVVAWRDGTMTVACSSGCLVSDLRLGAASLTGRINRLHPPAPVREIRFIHQSGGGWKTRI